MRKYILAGLAGIFSMILLTGATVDSDEYVREHSQYGRSDGPYQRKDSDGFDWFINGERQASTGKAVYEDFSEYGDGDMLCQQIDGTGCSGTAGEINLMTFPSGNKLACHIMGTQTIVGALDMDEASLDISGDQDENDGVECAWGTHGASGAPFYPGTDPAFFTCMQVSIANVSGTDEFYFGFRRADDSDGDVGGFNAAIDNYHDFVAWSFITAALGTVAIAMGLEGYLFTYISRWRRLFYMVAGILCLIPETITDTIGLILVSFLLWLHYRKWQEEKRNTSPPGA